MSRGYIINVRDADTNEVVGEYLIDDTTGREFAHRTQLKVRVEVFHADPKSGNPRQKIASYWMDHNDSYQRSVLGQQCRNVFEDGAQRIHTWATLK